MKGFYFFLRRALLVLLGMVAALFVGSWAFNLYLGIGVDGRNPPPGRLVDIGHTRLHINCTGTGSPAVILETGSNAWSSSWHLVQPQLAQTTRVCSYDRGGVGWSEPGARPRNYATQLAELDMLLERSGEAPPYVMVGWSYGGPLAWLYAAQHPDKVAGLVMVDSATFRYQRWIQETHPDLYSMSLLGPKVIGTIYDLGLAGTALALVAASGAADSLFESMQTRDLGFIQKGIPAILEEGGHLEESMQMFREIPPLGDLPLVVIESENVAQVPGRPGLGEELKAQSHADQLDLLRYSTAAEYTLARDSGHNIPYDAPRTIVDAVNVVLAKLRAKE